jgi:hypothetical protein
MIVRSIALVVGLGAFGAAPFQCGSKPDPELRREETAGDALWNLSQKFKADHNDAAARDTLRYLVDRYPSSRHTVAAKEELAKMGDTAAASAGDAGK